MGWMRKAREGKRKGLPPNVSEDWEKHRGT